MYDFITCPDRRNANSYKYKDMLKRNPDVPEGTIPFSVADMEFKNAPEIIEGLKEYLENNVLGYTAPSEGLLDAIKGWMAKRHNYNIEKEWIQLSDGVVPAIGDFIRAMTKEGEGIIILTPVYYPFRKSILLNNRKVVEVELINNTSKESDVDSAANTYTIDYDALEAAASDKNTTLIIFCNPHNPVGRVWTKEELRRVYEICVKHDVFIVDDEIHNDLIMPGYEHTVMGSVAEDAGKHMGICIAPSKSFNLAGMQTSAIIIEDPEIRKAFEASRYKGYRGVTNALGLEACRIAYTKCEKWLDECIEVIHENVDYFIEFMNEHFPEVKVYRTEGTYLIWCDFGAWGMDKDELEHFMAHEALLFTDVGYLFGDSGKTFERFNLACPKHILEDALNRLLEARR